MQGSSDALCLCSDSDEEEEPVRKSKSPKEKAKTNKKDPVQYVSETGDASDVLLPQR